MHLLSLRFQISIINRKSITQDAKMRAKIPRFKDHFTKIFSQKNKILYTRKRLDLLRHTQTAYYFHKQAVQIGQTFESLVVYKKILLLQL